MGRVDTMKPGRLLVLWSRRFYMMVITLLTIGRKEWICWEGLGVRPAKAFRDVPMSSLAAYRFGHGTIWEREFRSVTNTVTIQISNHFGCIQKWCWRKDLTPLSGWSSMGQELRWESAGSMREELLGQNYYMGRPWSPKCAMGGAISLGLLNTLSLRRSWSHTLWDDLAFCWSLLL